jgi:hypothetical protein
MKEKEGSIKHGFTEKEEKKILELARKRFDRSVEAFNKVYKKAIEVLTFKYGEQWPADQKKQREDAKRPALTVNSMSRFSNLVCGEMRRNKVQIKIAPSNSKGSKANAEIKAGLIKTIEYKSEAETIYDHAGKMLVDCGFAAGRVLSRYTEDEEDPFLQELYFESIDNPFSVHPDPNAKDSRFYSNGEYFFIDTPMTKEDFIEEYGKDALSDFEGDKPEGTEMERWYDDEKIIVREYFYKEYSSKTMVQLSDGRAMELNEAKAHIEKTLNALTDAKADQDAKRKDSVEAGVAFDESPIDLNDIPEILNEREIKTPHVKWLKITSRRILEASEWPGSIIPVAFSTGEYTNIKGERFYDGLFKDAIDPQKLINNSYSSLWEIISLMPKSPWQASAKMIEGYEDDYLSANAENFPLLKHRADADFPGQKPTQTNVGQMPVAMFQILQENKQNMKDAVGMYNADVGDQGPEVSGKAILARQAPSDTSTFVYHDNRAGFVAQIGKIANDAIPFFYDTERDVRIRGFNGKDSTVPINTTARKTKSAIDEDPQRYSGIDKKALKKALDKGVDTPFNDITTGKYDVVVMTGPAYQTQRQEAAENILNIAKIAGSTHPADLWHLVSTLDFPGAEEWAETVRKRVPPGMLPEEEDAEPAQPQPPTPEDILNMKKIDLETQKSKTEEVKLQHEIVKLQKELAESKEGVNKAVIDKLDEVFAPVHPADMEPPQQGNPNTQAPQELGPQYD